MNRAGALSDFQPIEIAVALFFAFAVMVGSGFALSASALDRPAAVPEIDSGQAKPVRVIPVLDLDAPLLKLGGKRDQMKLPDRWVKQAPKPRVEQKAFVSSQAGKTAEDIPGGREDRRRRGQAPPPDAEIAKQVDTPIVTLPEAGPPANVDQVGHADGVKEGTETDPLKARAVDLYRSRIIGWFSGRFRVSGSGLPQEELGKYRVGASVQLSPDRRVTSYTITPSGNAAFDAAAKATLEGVKGETIPPPPENYPDTVQSQINLTFVCRENRCD